MYVFLVWMEEKNKKSTIAENSESSVDFGTIDARSLDADDKNSEDMLMPEEQEGRHNVTSFIQEIDVFIIF